MDQKKNNTQKYKSISTGQPCSAAQYIAELVCIRRREKENTGSLEYKFWNKSKNAEYQTQVRAASKIIKKFSEKALLHYLNSPSGKNVYSLGFLHKSKKFVLILKFVEEGVAKSVKILEQQEKKQTKKTVLDPPEKLEYKSRKPRKQKNLFSQIRNIENNEDKKS